MSVAVVVLPDGSYLTDGKALFRVRHTITDGPQGELFVELEDCITFGLIFCSVRSLVELDFQIVQPGERPRRRRRWFWR